MIRVILVFSIGWLLAVFLYANIFNPVRYWNNTKVLVEQSAFRGCRAGGGSVDKCYEEAAKIRKEFDNIGDGVDLYLKGML